MIAVKSILAAIGLIAAVQGESGEYLNVIHPGNDDGSGFWNEKSIWFMYAPAFPFKTVAGAEAYRFTLSASDGSNLVFTASKPTAALSPVWGNVPVDDIRCVCEGIDAKGAVLGKAGERKFYRQAEFKAGSYPKGRGTYRDCAKGIYEYAFNCKGTKHLMATGELDKSDPITSYPSKYGAALIAAMVRYAELEPSKKNAALAVARKAGEYLLAGAEKPGTPLEHFTQTYQGAGEGAGTLYAGQHMLIYPACAANALLKLAEATGEKRWSDFAVKIAATYLRLQGADGTWSLKLKAADGSEVNSNRLISFEPVFMFETLFEKTGETKYRTAADRAFNYIYSTRITTWNWEGQFEDVRPTAPYQNLTKHIACDTALYLEKRFPGDEKHIAEMREILRFAEDQFVCWENPKGRDAWFTPCALEQYHCYNPIDASACKLIHTYLALYRAEGRKTDLEKAKTLADMMTRLQRRDGSLPTWWWTYRGGVDWLNCMVASAASLEELADTVGNKAAEVRGP